MTSKALHPSTIAAQGLGWTDEATGAVVLPMHTATTFLRDPDNQYRRGRSYGRTDNPSYDQPQAVLTALEGGRRLCCSPPAWLPLQPSSRAFRETAMWWRRR
jgi:cystathionine gamma-synthase